MDLGFFETGSNYAVQAGLEFPDIPLLLLWSTEGNLLKGKSPRIPEKTCKERRGKEDTRDRRGRKQNRRPKKITAAKINLIL